MKLRPKARWENKFYITYNMISNTEACPHALIILRSMCKGDFEAKILINKKTVRQFLNEYGVFPLSWVEDSLPLLINNNAARKLVRGVANRYYGNALEESWKIMDAYYKLWLKEQRHAQRKG